MAIDHGFPSTAIYSSLIYLIINHFNNSPFGKSNITGKKENKVSAFHLLSAPIGSQKILKRNPLVHKNI